MTRNHRAYELLEIKASILRISVGSIAGFCLFVLIYLWFH